MNCVFIDFQNFSVYFVESGQKKLKDYHSLPWLWDHTSISKMYKYLYKKIPKEFDDKFINLYDFFPSKTQQIETKYNKKKVKLKIEIK